MRRRIAWALSSLFVLAACSAPSSAPAQRGFYDRGAQLVPGVSTRVDVTRVFGPPHKLAEREWAYSYPNRADPASPSVAASLPEGQIVLLDLDFDAKGVLQQFRLSAMRELPLLSFPPDPNGPTANPDAPTGYQPLQPPARGAARMAGMVAQQAARRREC